MTRPIIRRSTLVGLAVALLVACVATPAPAQPAPAPSTEAGTVFAQTDRVAFAVARALADPIAADRIRAAVTAGPADLAGLDAGAGLARTVVAANEAVLAAKGLPAATGSLLRLRLAQPEMSATLNRHARPVVAAAPADDDLAAVVGYEPTGRTVRLDARRAPTRPVLVVEVDVAKALPAGLDVVRGELASHGLAAPAATRPAAARGGAAAGRGGAATATATTAGYWATQVTAVRLNDDKEPWIKGAAEIFCLVGGWGLDGKATVDAVQMPYLDHDGTVYRPNQLVVHFRAYKYDLADVVMMEDDGDTNYRTLVQAIVTALLTLTDAGAYAPLVTPILDAIPDSWYTDDPDYVDSWYTLATTTRGRLYGASANGWLDVQPYFVREL